MPIHYIPCTTIPSGLDGFWSSVLHAVWVMQYTYIKKSRDVYLKSMIIDDNFRNSWKFNLILKSYICSKNEMTHGDIRLLRKPEISPFSVGVKSRYFRSQDDFLNYEITNFDKCDSYWHIKSRLEFET